MPEISVIVPVYNVEKYLHACLDSILAQTFTDFELILIDDGSPDSSGKICDEYAEKDSRIRVFHQKNQGQAAARNFGVNQAKADWIHFVDSDDIIHPQMLELLFEAATRSNTDVSVAHTVIYENNIIPDSFYQSYKSEYILSGTADNDFCSLFEQHCYHSVCAKLIKKHLVVRFPFQSGRIHEDSPVICKWLYSAGKFSLLSYELYVYINNSDSTTKKTFSLRNLDLLWAWNEQERFYRKINYPKMRKNLLRAYFAAASDFYKKFSDSSPKYKSERLKLKMRVFFHAVKNLLVVVKDFRKDYAYYLEVIFPKLLLCYWVVINKLSRRRK